MKSAGGRSSPASAMEARVQRSRRSEKWSISTNELLGMKGDIKFETFNPDSGWCALKFHHKFGLRGLLRTLFLIGGRSRTISGGSFAATLNLLFVLRLHLTPLDVG